MPSYYNENDPGAAAWLRELIDAGLISDGVVDERSIHDVRPEDLSGFTRCHFFAGIGGWDYALQLAEWPDSRPVWTGSCPCQPFSVAGKRKGEKDERHLWSEFYRLIRECRPDLVFGEQVPGAIRHGWLDGISADLEGEGYAVGAIVLGAHSVGAPHIRQRLYWVANTTSLSRAQQFGESGQESRREAIPQNAAEHSGFDSSGLEHAASDGRNKRRTESSGRSVASGCGGSGLGGTNDQRPQGRVECGEGSSQCVARSPSAWSDYVLIPCRDGKTRRIKSGLEPLAHGIPGRVGLLRGYGNAIVPQVAAEFIKAFIESMGM